MGWGPSKYAAWERVKNNCLGFRFPFEMAAYIYEERSERHHYWDETTLFPSKYVAEFLCTALADFPGTWSHISGCPTTPPPQPQRRLERLTIVLMWEEAPSRGPEPLIPGPGQGEAWYSRLTLPCGLPLISMTKYFWPGTRTRYGPW